MIPTQDLAHVAEAAALLIDQYKLTKITGGLTAVFAQEIQTLENAVWSVLNKVTIAAQPIGGGNWDVLDKLGAIVGIARNSLSDVNYLAQIKIKIRVNRSDGLADDIIAISALLVSAFVYVEYPPAAFEVTAVLPAIPPETVTALLTYLHEARGAGVAGNLRYIMPGVWTLAAHGWASSIGSVPTPFSFGDSVSHALGGELVSLQGLG